MGTISLLAATLRGPAATHQDPRVRPALSHARAGPFTSQPKETLMPESHRYPMTELPGTLKRSCREAQETFLRALDDAVRAHGPGDQAHRIAYAALKRDFEKRGDHWIAKPAEYGGYRETG